MSETNNSYQLYYFDQRSVITKAELSQSIEPVTLNQPNLPCDRGYLFGDGFFTTALIESGLISHLPWHIKRLTIAAEKLQFLGLNIDCFLQAISHKIKDVNSASIRISVSRGQTKRGYAVDQGSVNYHIVVQINDLIEPVSRNCQLIYADTPVSVNSALAGIKHLNRLDNVLAANEIQQVDQEALMTDGEQVICGSRTNLFVLHQGTWLTPRVDKAGINGVTRQRIIDLMGKYNVPFEEAIITKELLENAQTAFVCNSLMGVWPASQLLQHYRRTQKNQKAQNIQLKKNKALKHITIKYKPSLCIDLIKQIKFCR
jgi:4-amino-4-deoxychorismate lyase